MSSLRVLSIKGNNRTLFYPQCSEIIGISWHFGSFSAKVCKSSNSRKLERVQERALRAVYCDWTSTYEQLLSLANLPTLLNRRLQDIAILMYKVKHNICPTYICDLFSKNQCPYNIRVKEFVIPRVNTVNHGKHSIRLFGTRVVG